jgi:hypothetical protein
MTANQKRTEYHQGARNAQLDHDVVHQASDC